MMNLESIKSKIGELKIEKSELCKTLATECWKIKKLEKTKTLDVDIIAVQTEKKVKLIPDDFFLKYRAWYSNGKGLLEGNHDKESLREYEEAYRDIKNITKDKYVAENEQNEIIKLITNQLHIIESIPQYIDGKSHSFKLVLASTLLGDELKEARYLYDHGFYRAAGALAGVILERWLKLKFDEAKPKIKYGEKATLGRLIKIAEEKNVFDNSTIKKLKYLNSVRINCDHDKEKEPREKDVEDLLDQTDRFIHNME